MMQPLPPRPTSPRLETAVAATGRIADEGFKVASMLAAAAAAAAIGGKLGKPGLVWFGAFLYFMFSLYTLHLALSVTFRLVARAKSAGTQKAVAFSVAFIVGLASIFGLLHLGPVAEGLLSAGAASVSID